MPERKKVVGMDTTDILAALNRVITINRKHGNLYSDRDMLQLSLYINDLIIENKELKEALKNTNPEESA